MKYALAEKLLSCMKLRENQLLDNELFSAALYLDPRYNRLLSQDQIFQATRLLLHTWKRVTNLEKNEEGTDEPENDIQMVEVYDDDDDVENFIKENSGQQYCALEKVLNENDETISMIVKQFIELPRENNKCNIFQYWESKRQVSPVLYKLACIFNAVPGTQVSVERLFSNLKFLLSYLRFNIDESLMENIILVRSFDKFNS